MSHIKNGTRTPGNTNENTIHLGPCILHGVYPELTTTGTITIRDGVAGTTVHVCAIGLTQAGKSFGGIRFSKALTIQLSVATDLSMIVWEPIP